ncbi:MAG: 1-(5-phosphoribosyl)-5-[(5-phosphoribosylamino)methylideneamino]imidazole-4-carboxamide isomerase [Muribaculaceae bacterium]|nr:1-(5-phosphoribosyl)-5-[(5-phosphoribosylamino)methylideneamino]imidazole-4-carboxamide isomerase [Muribaculaceae bacterium]
MIEIVPAIDIIEGKCVRLSQGDYGKKKVYNESPLEVARQFEDCGCSRLHLVDLDGASSQHIVNYKILDSIAGKTSLVVDFGGGLKSDEDIKIAFECGASMITGGSIAVKNPDLFIRWIEKYGGKKIILGADSNNGKIAVSGWAEDSGKDIIPFISEYVARGITKVISTDIQCDGMLGGTSTALYKEITEKVDGIYLIASGGVGSMADIEALEAINLPEVIVGKAIYEGFISLSDLENFNKQR